MDAKDLKGIPMIAIQDGEKVGEVDRVLFDLAERRVQALTVRSGGLLGGSLGIVDMADVKSIGSDAVMIPSREVVHEQPADDRYRGLPDLDRLTSLRVVTADGTLLGHVASVQLDERTGAMTAIGVSKGGLTAAFKSPTLVPIGEVISIGPDVAVVPAGAIGEREGGAEEAADRGQSPPVG